MKKEGLPLVVCELKYKKEGGFTTHDVLTYSTKAIKHKEVYPYLRYGFIAGNTGTLTNKFFTHNAGFDFAMAMTKLNRTVLEKFVDIVRNQIENAESLLNLLTDKNRTTVFNTRLELKNT